MKIGNYQQPMISCFLNVQMIFTSTFPGSFDSIEVDCYLRVSDGLPGGKISAGVISEANHNSR